uniref:Uncharacterized protein n=1 Tax=Gopherus agassizii TaxID=38772 RepID=A0A452J475_9SAUR
SALPTPVPLPLPAASSAPRAHSQSLANPLPCLQSTPATHPWPCPNPANPCCIPPWPCLKPACPTYPLSPTPHPLPCLQPAPCPLLPCSSRTVTLHTCFNEVGREQLGPTHVKQQSLITNQQHI